MKKTEKTALTAALFAAAMYGTTNAAAEPVEASAYFNSTTTSVVGEDSVVNGNVDNSFDAITDIKSKMAAVYGPPPTTTIPAEDDEEITRTTTRTQPVYGPPSVFTTTAPDDEDDNRTTTAPIEDDEEVTITTTRTQPVYGPPSVFTTTADEPWETTTKLETTIATVYGPPSIFTTTTSSDDTVTTTTTDKVIAELETNGQPVYGPAPFYGDVNNDGRTDVFDMILLRERFAENNTEYSFLYDVNYDMKISIADLVLVNKYLLGQIDDIRYPEKDNVTTTVAEDENDVSTTTTVTFAPLYGPPPAYN